MMLCGKSLFFVSGSGSIGAMCKRLLITVLLSVASFGAAEQAPVDVRESARSQLAPEQSMRPSMRLHAVPATRWNARSEAALWTRAMLSALKGHASPLVESVPRDIADWCPGYAGNSASRRAAFWAGFASALAKHESTYRPEAVGGGGRWYGLLQILPATARGYGCRAGTGAALKDGAENLSCALRIMAVTVPRDNAVSLRDGRWRGVAADWGPMRSASKRRDMAGWLRSQDYCRKQETSPRPRPRPERS